MFFPLKMGMCPLSTGSLEEMRVFRDGILFIICFFRPIWLTVFPASEASIRVVNLLESKAKCVELVKYWGWAGNG